MYKVKYTRLAILKDKTTGNLSQGDGTAYLDCGLNEVESNINKYLSEHGQKYIAIINSVESIKGHIA